MAATYYLTSNPLDAFMAAQTSVGAALTAVVWFRPLRPWPASVLYLAAVWMAVVAPVEPTFANGFGLHVAPTHLVHFLGFAALLATVALFIAHPRWLGVAALVLQFELSRLAHWAQDSDFMLAAAYLLAFGGLLGAQIAFASPEAPSPLPMPSTARRRDDLVLFLAAAAIGVVVANVILIRLPNSGDEWANIYQADLFAQGKAYGKVPPCWKIFQNFWVFPYMGRTFSQYTPGWPLFMAPFEKIGAPWLANGVALGGLAVGAARLARRAVSTGLSGVGVMTERHVRAAGWLAGAMATLGPSAVLHGGSEYPHLFVGTCYAWAVESLCAMTSPETIPRYRWRWGVALGAATAFMAASRPGEGALLGSGIFLYFVYSAARRRVNLPSFLAMGAIFAVIMGLTLVILRLQIGQWFKTGYDVTGVFHPWAVMVMRPAGPSEFKYVWQLDAGAWFWWPAAPALGLAGLLTLRGRGRGIAFTLLFGTGILLYFFYFPAFNHNQSTGFGPRCHLPLVVVMAVGGAALLTPLFAMVEKGRTRLGAPAALALAAMLLGVIRIAPLVYPEAWFDQHRRTAPLRAIQEAHLHHAVVTVTRHEVWFDPMDLAQNLPRDPMPDVLVLHDFGGPDIECGKHEFADRYWYHAKGMEEVTLEPITK